MGWSAIYSRATEWAEKNAKKYVCQYQELEDVQQEINLWAWLYYKENRTDNLEYYLRNRLIGITYELTHRNRRSRFH